MSPVRINDDNIVTALNAGSWVILILMAIAGWFLISARFATGVLAGGMLAIANFYWLGSILKRALALSAGKAGKFAQARYILRLALIAVIAWLLITRMGIDLIGLLVGMSVLVINIFVLTIYRLTCKGG